MSNNIEDKYTFTTETIGGFTRVTAKSAEVEAMVAADAAFQEQLRNASPVDHDVYRVSLGPNAAFGELQPRDSKGLGAFTGTINEDTIIKLPGTGGMEGRVKEMMAAGLIGKTPDGQYVLNYDTQTLKMNNQPQPQYHPQRPAKMDPVDHVGTILHGMGLDAVGILQELSAKDHGSLELALDAVGKGDSSKFIELLAKKLK